MEAIHLRSVDDEIPSSPIACAHERNGFCISNTSQLQNSQSLEDFLKNRLETDIETTVSLPLTSYIEVIQNSNLSDYDNQILFSNHETKHVSLKKRLKKGPITFKPFESFRALEETVHELNCYFRSEYKKKQNGPTQAMSVNAQNKFPKIKISVQ